MCSLQVDAPQVSGRGDGVALRAQLLVPQSPEPAFFTMDVPALDGGERHGVGIHADETLVSVSSQNLPLQLSDSSLQSVHGGSRGVLLCYLFDLAVFTGARGAGGRAGG